SSSTCRVPCYAKLENIIVDIFFKQFKNIKQHSRAWEFKIDQIITKKTFVVINAQGPVLRQIRKYQSRYLL
ncbi:hypothetical protein DD595_25415, partial [Enterobacter cloacae complex sp. 4DZ3-17B2]